MDKKFDEWNEIKKKTDETQRQIGLKAREIYWLKMGENIGYEQSGKGKNFARPAIIIKKLNKDLFLGIPTSTTFRKENDFFYPFEYQDKDKNIIKATALIVQLKVYSIKRVMNKIGMMKKDDFEILLEKSHNLIAPTKK